VAIAYLGLTRADPVVIAPLVDVPVQATTVSGTASGGEGTFPIGTGERVRAIFTVDGQGSGLVVNESTGAYSSSVSWTGAATETHGTMRVLHWDTDADGAPTRFLGFGENADVAVSAGVALAGVDVAMDPVAESSITGSVTLAEGSTLVSRSVFLDIDDHPWTDFVTDESGALDFDDVVPDLAGTSFDVGVQTQDASGGSCQSIARGYAAGAAGISLSPPQAPTLSSPEDGSPAVAAGATLAWDAPEDGVSYVYVFPTTPGSGPTYFLVTQAQTASLPDLTGLGTAYPAGVGYSWNANALVPVTGVDELAVARSLLFRPEGLFERDRISRCISAPRSFTTAP
jgi:hypothetical protein